MNDFLTIIRPKMIGLRNIFSRPGNHGRARFIFVAFFTVVVWLLMFLFTVKVLNNLKAGELLGEILCRKFMGFIWLSGAVLLLFSSLITSLSSFYLSKDLDLLMAAPVSLESLFWARSAQSLLSASWMPVAFMLPLFLAYGFVFKAFFIYYLLVPLVALPTLATFGFISQMIIIFLVHLLPARRTRDIMSLLAIVMVCVLYIAFRLMRPEDLLNPQVFMSAAAYLAALETPTAFFLPTPWAVDFLWPFLTLAEGPKTSWFLLALLWFTAASLGILASSAASWLYFSGYNKSVEGASRQKTAGSVLNIFTKAVGFFMQAQRRAFVVKDLKIFFRDHTQWSQLLLLASLIVIYIYNFSLFNLGRFPLNLFFLENAFAFLNIALVALIAATLALRFAFPAISAEGFSYWIIRSAPISLKDFMLIKFWLWVCPIFFISIFLIVASGSYLNVGPIMTV
ncbi:MAG: putative ABC transporter permease subunit, partial [Candidatus Adiutrix sp.]